MAKHVDDMRPYDQEPVRNAEWAYGERAYWRTAEKFENVISEMSNR